MAVTYREPVRLRANGLSSRELGGELVILDFDNSHYLTVRGSGVVLFELLHEECSREHLVTELLARFDVDEHTARRDVDTFLAELSDAGLLGTEPSVR